MSSLWPDFIRIWSTIPMILTRYLGSHLEDILTKNLLKISESGTLLSNASWTIFVLICSIIYDILYVLFLAYILWDFLLIYSVLLNGEKYGLVTDDIWIGNNSIFKYEVWTMHYYAKKLGDNILSWIQILF